MLSEAVVDLRQLSLERRLSSANESGAVCADSYYETMQQSPSQRKIFLCISLVADILIVHSTRFVHPAVRALPN